MAPACIECVVGKDTPETPGTKAASVVSGVGNGLALEAGGSINIFSLSRCGYLLQYFTVGMMTGGIPATQYGLFICYLNVPAYVAGAAATVASLPWSFKVVFALLSDTVPIGGYRRRPYMVFGWAITAIFLIVLALLPLPAPYYCTKPDGTYDVTAVCNPDAQHSSATIIICMMFVAFGYIIADVAADALTVQYARREAMAERGRTQTMAYLIRQWGSVAAALLVGFGMNGPEYNGSFRAGISFSAVCGILAVPALAMVPASWLLVEEEPVPGSAAAIARGLTRKMESASPLSGEGEAAPPQV